MPKLAIAKSITINAPADKIFAHVRNFKNWPKWSPWLIAEPDCSIGYAEDGDSYHWDGRIIGMGEIMVTGEDAPHSIDYQLTFLKPWKSLSTVRFTFSQNGDSTEVKWAMDSSIPFFLFFLKKMMTAFVGMDYERGLSMLKDEIETGSVPVKLDFVLGEIPACPTYIVKHTGPYRHLGSAWSSGIMHARAKIFRKDNAIPPFEIYENNPNEVPENDLVTLVHFPAK